VAAPSRLLRPSGDGVKTDAKDALHLARLLAVGDITEVAVPDEETEAARDLVRARDDVRGDLMSARHRVTHLLLRQGIVYSGGTPWTREHENWLRTRRFARPGCRAPTTRRWTRTTVSGPVDWADCRPRAGGSRSGIRPVTPSPG
jgi:transposase